MPHIQRVPVRDVEIAYEAFGDPSDPAVVLVMGLGPQMLAWPDEFCGHLAGSGRYVVRFDNPDCGLSTHLDWLAAPDPARVLLRRETAPYRIENMAADTLGLMDALGLDRVDLVGASMGGFIVQAAALASPGPSAQPNVADEVERLAARWLPVAECRPSTAAPAVGR